MSTSCHGLEFTIGHTSKSCGILPCVISSKFRSAFPGERLSLNFSIVCRLLKSLASLFPIPILVFNSLRLFLQNTAVAYPRRHPSVSAHHKIVPTVHSHPAFRQTRERSPISFRMNTCKSVSKQRTLTPFRMNTCEKTRGGELLLTKLAVPNSASSVPLGKKISWLARLLDASKRAASRKEIKL